MTLPMLPISTPATWAVWPWPGVTAWALASSTLISNGLGSKNGNRSRCSVRMYTDTAPETTIRPMIASTGRRFLRMTRIIVSAAPSGCG